MWRDPLDELIGALEDAIQASAPDRGEWHLPNIADQQIWFASILWGHQLTADEERRIQPAKAWWEERAKRLGPIPQDFMRGPSKT